MKTTVGKIKRWGGMLGVSLLFAFSGVSGAVADYTEAPVADGGSIAGKVTFKGAQPPPAAFAFSKFPNEKFCAQADSDGKGNRIRQDVKVKDGGLADAVVYIEKIEKGKPFKHPGTDVAINGCRFQVQGGPSQAVGVVVKKSEIRVTNNDADASDPKSATGVLHNPHTYDIKGTQSTTLFNKPLPTKGQVLKESIKPIWFKKEDSFMKMECDQHNYMNAWFVPVTNPYYAIVGEDGSFEIGDVPPGKYTVKAWHPILGFQKQEIEVAAKGKAATVFEFASK